jgi:hypothetical protein
MSTFISAVHAAFSVIHDIAPAAALRVVLSTVIGLALLMLFKPLLLGIVRAFVLLLKPKRRQTGFAASRHQFLNF